MQKPTEKPLKIFGVVKTQSPNFYKSPTPFVVVKTDSEPLQASNTLCSSETYSPHFYKPPTHLLVSKQTLQTSTSSYTLCIRKKGLSKLLQASNMLWSSQSTISKLLQASYTLWGGENELSDASNMLWACKNGLSEVLRASYPLCGSQNGLSKLLRASYTLAVIKRTLRTSTSHLPTLCYSKRTLRTSTSLQYVFGVVKIQSPIFCKPPTPFVVVKTECEPLQASNMICSSENILSALLQASHTPSGGQNKLSKFLQALTRFELEKRDFPNLCKPPICVGVVKHNHQTSTSLQHALSL